MTPGPPGAGPALLFVGELTVDDVVVEDVDADWKQPGGGALYSAVGSLVWQPGAAINAAVGTDYPEPLLARLRAAGLDLRGVARGSGVPSIGLWLLYEASGARRQLEKADGATMLAMDLLRPAPYADGEVPAGVHLAPQSSEGHVKAAAQLAGGAAVRTLDLLVEPYIDRAPYLDGSVLRGLDAFLPSAQEVRDLWGHDDVLRLGRWLEETGVGATLVVKRGPEGADVLVDGSVVRVPSVTADVVDPTGAGDAFCGGFLAGLVATGDPVEAAVRGVVSASFVCQTRGALAAIGSIDPDTAHRRATLARRGTRKVP